MKTIKYLLLGTVLMLGACEGEELLDSFLELEEELTKQYVNNEAALNNVYATVDVALRTADLSGGDTTEINGADVYQHNGVVFIDYGQGEIGPDGLTRTGKVLVTETGDYEQSGGQLAVSFDNFTVEEKAVSGNIDVLNLGNDSLSMAVNGFSVGEEFSLNSNKTLTWKNGFDTETEDDDLYELIGQATGSDMNNNSVSGDITEKLVLDNTCGHKVVSGIMDLSFDLDTSATTSSGSLDFLSADGCNNIVKLDLDNGEQEVSLTHQFSGF